MSVQVEKKERNEIEFCYCLVFFSVATVSEKEKSLPQSRSQRPEGTTLVISVAKEMNWGRGHLATVETARHTGGAEIETTSRLLLPLGRLATRVIWWRYIYKKKNLAGFLLGKSLSVPAVGLVVAHDGLERRARLGANCVRQVRVESAGGCQHRQKRFQTRFQSAAFAAFQHRTQIFRLGIFHQRRSVFLLFLLGRQLLLARPVLTAHLLDLNTKKKKMKWCSHTGNGPFHFHESFLHNLQRTSER